MSHVEGPLLLLAGAGSGKTRVITHRMAHLMEAHRVPGPGILAVTFTNKAADEMRNAGEQSAGRRRLGDGPLVSTFHSFCVRLLRRDGAQLAEIRPGFTRQFTIYDDDDQLAVDQIDLSSGSAWTKSSCSIARCAPGSATTRATRNRPKRSTATPPIRKRRGWPSIYEQYEGRLRQANALDFDDLLLEAVRLLAHDDDLRQQYQSPLRIRDDRRIPGHQSQPV